MRHLERVGQPGTVMVALVGDVYLRLVLEAAEGEGVQNAVAVTLKRRPIGQRAPAVHENVAARGVRTTRGVGSQRLGFDRFQGGGVPTAEWFGHPGRPCERFEEQ